MANPPIEHENPEPAPRGVSRRALLAGGLGTAGVVGVGAYLGRNRIGRFARSNETDDPFFGSLPFADDVNKQIKGFASADSYQAGDTLELFVSVAGGGSFSVEILEAGWFDGQNHRIVHDVSVEGIEQPGEVIDAASGTVRCPWVSSFSMPVPASWSSGVYLALLRRDDGFANYVPFVIRDTQPSADIIYVHPTSTYQAYNAYPIGAGGKSLYDYNSSPEPTSVGNTRAYTVSGNRPYDRTGDGGFFVFGLAGLLWLSRKGWNVTTLSTTDVHRNPELLLGAKCVISGGHDEYWTSTRYDAFIAARESGTSLLFVGANTAYWQIRYEEDGAGSLRPDITCYKSDIDDPKKDPDDVTTLTRQAGRPEQALVGIGLMNVIEDTEDLDQRDDFIAENTDHWAYADTGMSDGDVVPGILGNETDARDPVQPLPDSTSFVRLGMGTVSGDMGDTIAETILYETDAGALVFASGTLAWEEALDLNHPLYDERIDQLTSNIVNRMLRKN